jgi:hypothetical protein
MGDIVTSMLKTPLVLALILVGLPFAQWLNLDRQMERLLNKNSHSAIFMMCSTDEKAILSTPCFSPIVRFTLGRATSMELSKFTLGRADQRDIL